MRSVLGSSLVLLLVLPFVLAVPVPPAGARSGQGRQQNPVSFDDWEFWWEHNRSAFEHVRRRQAGHDPATPPPGPRWTDANESVAKVALPALERVLAEPNLHQDVHAAAWIALARIASSPAHVRRVLERVRAGRENSLHAWERAVLALGLFQRDAPALRFDGALLDEVRAVLFGVLEDTTASSRARGFAATALALLADQPRADEDPAAAARNDTARLLDLLAVKHTNPEVAVGVAVALGLLPPDTVTAAQRALLVEAATKGTFRDVPLVGVARAHLAGALGRLGTAEEVKPLVTLLRTRRGADTNARRSAAIALGQIAARHAGDGRDRAVVALLHAVDRQRDDTTRSFALIALGRILAAAVREGRPVPARIMGIGDHLQRIAARGRYAQRPFGALAAALALREIPDPETRRELTQWRTKMGTVLAEGIESPQLDMRRRGAFAVAAGIADARVALRALWELVEDPGTDRDLRSAACEGLGLMRACPPVGLVALETVVRERPASADLEMRAIRALAMHEGRADAPFPASPEPQSPTLLRRLAADPDPNARGWVLLYLAHVGDLRALDAVAAIAGDASELDRNRSIAVSALGAIAEPAWEATLERLARGLNYRAQSDVVSELLSVL